MQAASAWPSGAIRYPIGRALTWLVVLTLTLAPLGAAAAKIYRSVDADGNVVFSDLPPAARSSANSAANAQTQQPVEMALEEPNTYQSSSTRTPYVAAPKPSVSGAYYKQLNIVKPTQEESFRNNAGNVAIVAVTQPPVVAAHRLQLLLDGAESGVSPQGSSFHLGNVDRGTHSVRVRVLDDEGQVLIESAPVTFHLQRFSIAN